MRLSAQNHKNNLGIFKRINKLLSIQAFGNASILSFGYHLNVRALDNV